MKKLAFVLAVLFGTIFASTPASAASDTTTPFTFWSFEATYELSRSSDNVSHLKVKEILKPLFSAYGNTNHGIDRVIPNRFLAGNKQSWDLGVEVTSGAGGWPYFNKDSNRDATTVRIGDASNNLHNVQTFKIDWTARDVVMPNSIITNKTQDGDEFHWMVNGDGWDQTFASVEATVLIPPDLVNELDGRVACWNNELESQCSIEETMLEDGTKKFVFTSLSKTEKRKSLVFDIGFKPETFAFPANFSDGKVSVWLIIGLILLCASPFLIYFGRQYLIVRRNKKIINALPTIPEFVAPSFASLAECEVFWSDKNLVAPLLLDLATNGYISITADEKGHPAGLIYQKAADGKMADQESGKLLAALFEGRKVGDQISFGRLKRSQTFGKVVYDMEKDLFVAQFGQDKFYLGRRTFKDSGKLVGGFSIIAAVLLFMPLRETFFPDSPEIMTILIAGVAILAILVGITSRLLSGSKVSSLMKKRKMTQRGADLYRYLSGLKEFMVVSEADRIKMLQSPHGAEQVGTVIDGKKVKLIKLYERLLPFATIFGIEKEWGRVLQVYYTEVNYQPGFYHGYISGYAWGSVLGGLSSDARALSGMEANRLAALSRSSSWSSGGSSGSGFSGGGGSFGGGGGGGGGW